MTHKRKSKQVPLVDVKTPSKSKRVLGRDTKGLVMVRSAIDPDSRFFVASEQADDSVIADELAGKMVQQCVYEFTNAGQKVQGLTVVGVREAMRLINRNPKSGMKLALDHSRMFIEEVTFNGERGILVKCFAYDHVSGAGNWGIKFTPFLARRRDGSTYSDTFVVEKTTSKAQRNAIAGLIPVELKVRMIQKFVKSGSVAQLAAPKEVVVAKPPIEALPATKPEDLVRIIQSSIEKLDDPEQLHKLADKVERTPKLSKPQKAMLVGQARSKANAIIDKSIS